ncbi:MAG: sulfite exporter TauE/SafE family protein [Proteobacteria bacterium]|nr:MAG: sulfite exporter TauE/SafE family protein [Pseudomonadota bacterium]
MTHDPAVTAAIAAVAFLYASVGHAGASGYIAVMSLAGMAPAEIKPTALALNILVATLGSWQFWRAGHFSWRLFWPFALLSVPLAFLGGWLALPTAIFKLLVGIVLLFSAARFFLRPPADAPGSPPTALVAVPVGGALGLLAGLTGTGGGIFLTPLLIFLHWAPAKTASAVSALFILVNSTAGLAGHWTSVQSLPPQSLAFAIAAGVGGAFGARLGSRRLPPIWIQRLLAVVLTIAGAKLVFGL